MISQLTQFERKIALFILILTSLVGLFLYVAGGDDPIAIHGIIVILFCSILVALIWKGRENPEPSQARLDDYYDDPTKVGLILSILWGVVGMAVGDWVVSQTEMKAV